MAKNADPTNWKLVYSNKHHRDNQFKAIEFRNPDWIPCSVSIFPAVWKKYRGKLRELVAQHPFIFGTAAKARINYDYIPLEHRADSYYTDNWGCKWYNAAGGYIGLVVESPLEDWGTFKTYKFPDPLKYTEMGKQHWFLVKMGLRIAHARGAIRPGGGERLFDRLYFLRGFDNLMTDFARREPKLQELINRLRDHEITLSKQWLRMGSDIIYFHTDIGAQDRLMISPKQFRKYIKPMFADIFQPIREAGAHVYLSSDGYLLDIVDDLIECGVSVHDPQFNANTLKGIEKHYKGKMCVDLDLDRQNFPFMSPQAIRNHIRESVETLNTPEGGLMMSAEISDTNIPLKNIKAICEGFEEFCVPKR